MLYVYYDPRYLQSRFFCFRDLNQHAENQELFYLLVQQVLIRLKFISSSTTLSL
jgi:hypothetical protein